jgi:hypothetical protein
MFPNFEVRFGNQMGQVSCSFPLGYAYAVGRAVASQD